MVEEEDDNIEIEEWVDEKEDDKEEVVALVMVGGFVKGLIDVAVA